MHPNALPGMFNDPNFLYPNVGGPLPQHTLQQQKVALGEALYPHVSQLQPKRAAKVIQSRSICTKMLGFRLRA